jgi:hypothetical protein
MRRPERPYPLVRAVARGASLYAILLGLFWCFGESAFEHLQPVFKHELGVLLPEFDVQTLDLVRGGREPVVRLDAVAREAVFAGIKLTAARPGSRLSVSTTLGHIWQPVMLLVTFGFAWPASNARRLTMRMLAAVALCGLVVLVDVPFVLVGTLRDMIYARFAPDQYALVTRWGTFMDSGGRLALAVSAGLVCAALGKPLRTADAASDSSRCNKPHVVSEPRH